LASGYVSDIETIRIIEQYAKEFGYTRLTYGSGKTTYVRMNNKKDGYYPSTTLVYSHGLDYVKFYTDKKMEKFKISDLALGILENVCIHRIKE
jgi:hypothetical protein